MFKKKNSKSGASNWNDIYLFLDFLEIVEVISFFY